MSTSKPKKPLKASTSSLDPAPSKKPTKKKVKGDKPAKGTRLAQDDPLEDEDYASNGSTPSTAARVKKPKAPQKSAILPEEDLEEPVGDQELPTRTKPASASKGKRKNSQPRSASGADTSRSRASTGPQSSMQQSADAAGTGGKKSKALKSSGSFGSEDDDDGLDEGHPEGGDDEKEEVHPEDHSDDESDFAVNWKYVPMASPQDSARPTPAEFDDEILYTRLMTFCWAVATYDSLYGRTLVHFQGSDPDAYYPELAGMISEQAVVTVNNGSDSGSREGFQSEFRTAKGKVKAAMAAAGEETSQLTYTKLYSSPEVDRAAGKVPGTLKIMPDGTCSRLTVQESDALQVIEDRRRKREIRERKRLEQRARRREERRQARSTA